MANFQAQAPMNGRSKVAVRAAILGKAEFGVSRVCLFYWMRRARGELRLVSGRVRRTLPAPRNARLVLEIHENSAIVVLEDSCDILHKSSVSPSWRRTSPADVHPIDGKAVSMSRIRLSPFPRSCGVIGLAAVLTLPPKMSEFPVNRSIG